MNFDHLNPLSNYLAKNGVTGGEMSDWGIEEASSRATSHFSGYDSRRRPSFAQQLYFDDVQSQSQHSNHDFQYYYHKLNPHPIPATTANFSKYIKKYLSLQNITGEFWEKFKYNLVVSNVLDDSMILSKNEQSLNELVRKQSENDSPVKSFEKYPTFIDGLNSDGSVLKIMNVRYNLKYPSNYNNFNYILPIINLVIFLLKQRHQSAVSNRLSAQSSLKLFKLLLIVASKLFKFKRLNYYIKTSQNLQFLNTFLLLNYKLNKKIITNLLAYKELEVYNFLNQPSSQQDNTSFKNDLQRMLLNSLHILNFNLKSSITQLLPYLNGDLFEQYCMINNVDTEVLTQNFEDLESDEDNEDINTHPLNRIVFNVKKFNQLRKLMICELLTFNEVPIKKNFFVYKLMDQMHLSSTPILSESLNLTSIQKLNIMAGIFGEHNQVLESTYSTFDRFDQFYLGGQMKKHPPEISLEHQDILSLKNLQSVHVAGNDNNEINGVVTMINKLSNLTTNLKFFNKYNQSIKGINNVDELNEKVMIFNQFSDDLNAIKQLYQTNLADLQSELTNQDGNFSPTTSRSSSGLTSPRTSLHGNQGLKSFHNSSIKKRYSLPVSTLKSPNSPISPMTPMMESTPANASEKSPASSTSDSSGKKYKRLSTGLSLGLLTVFEDSDRQSSKPNKRASGGNKVRASNNTFRQNKDDAAVCFDDNYINILPPASYETYNKHALDQLSNGNHNKKHSFRDSNRFSLNSVNSNVSGISEMISSTQITSFIEDEENNDEVIKGNHSTDDGQHISKDELRIKLEESFSRIYSLENENKILKQNMSNEETPSNGHADLAKPVQEKKNTLSGESEPDVPATEVPASFLSELESKLKRPDNSNELT